jgi:hypothetical protein
VRLLKIRALLWGARLAFRFVSGRPMSGERKTDATFWTPARHSLDPSGKALRWEMMRGAARAAWRMGVLYLLLLLLIVLPASWIFGRITTPPWWFSFSFLLWGHVSVIGGSILVYGARRTLREYGALLPSWPRDEETEKRRLEWRRIEGRRDWRREKVLPVARVVSTIATVHIPDSKAEHWITIPKNYRDGGVVQVRLPERFTGVDKGVQTRLVGAISAKLGVPHMSPSWALEGSNPSLHLVAPPQPPEKVLFSHPVIRRALEDWEECRPLLGLEGGDAPFYAEMEEDSPHIGLSAGPGAGKSTLIAFIAAQALHWGWGVIVIDWKQSGAFDWMGGLEGVTYISDIEKIHDMGIRLAEEVEDRKRNGMAGKAKVLVIRDEWNVTAPLLYDYWAIMRSTAEPDEKRTMPNRSPALSGFAVLDFAGREYGLHDLAVAQKFSARIFNGNADIRECFGIKLLARYTEQTRKMLAPDIKPFPRKSNTRGRWTVVIADQATVVQSPLCTDEELRAWAASGRENPKFPLGQAPTQLVEDREYLGNVFRPDATGHSETSLHVNSPEVGLKLSELVDRLEPFGITLNILRNAAREDEKGDPDFPKPISGSPNKGYRYSPLRVTEWARKRNAKVAAERNAK